MDINLTYILLPLLLGWLADRFLGDPHYLPHPIVGFGKIISWGNRLFNKGDKKLLKGAVFSLAIILLTFLLSYFFIDFLNRIHSILSIIFSTIVVFYCLAGKTLVDEVKQVFIATDLSVEEGRKQVSRIVGRDTSALSPQQIRTAALETLSENLSDGVIAPLFWFALLGAPGMLAYKMINTLDSMIGYKNEKYRQFGCWAAHIDDIANYIPARLTAFLMILVNGNLKLFAFVKKFARQHASPNSGYPESALAGILGCRFGGTFTYFDKIVEKPYIGEANKIIDMSDMKIAISINCKTEIAMLFLILIFSVTINKLVL